LSRPYLECILTGKFPFLQAFCGCVGAGNALMTIPIKIECGCGQHYAFDVEADGEISSPAQ
jgi:hypothetical protein